MRRYGYVAAAAIVAALAALPASPALADPGAVLTYGSVAGTDVPVGDTITAGLATGTAATFFSSADGTTGISCATSTFTATVTDNPVAPGVATESLTDQTFADCTANVFGVSSVQSITVQNLPYTVTVDDSTGAAVVSGAPIQTTVVLGTLLGTITCVYQADSTVNGVADNTDNSLNFSSQQFDKTSGPGTCFNNGFFTAKYAPILDTTQDGSPAVFVN